MGIVHLSQYNYNYIGIRCLHNINCTTYVQSSSMMVTVVVDVVTGRGNNIIMSS